MNSPEPVLGDLDPPIPAPRRAALQRSLRALHNHTFRLFAMGLVVSTIGSWMQMLAQSWLVLKLTDSGTALGAVFAFQMLPMLVLGPWAGVVADRVDNRRILIWTSAAGLVQALAIGTMQATGHVTVNWIYFFALWLGIASTFDRTAIPPLIYEVTGPNDLSSAIGIGATITSTGRLFGPGLAGLFLATVGTAPVFFANAATFAVLLVVLVGLRHAPRHIRRGTGTRPRLREGFRHVWDEPTLRLGMGVMLVVGTFAYNFGTLVPAMVHFEFHASPLALGVVQGVGGVGAILGGLLAGSLRRPTTRLLGLVAIGFGACIGLSAVAPGVWVFAAVWLPLGLSSAVFTTVDQTLLQRESGPEFQGRVMSLFGVAWLGTTPVGGLLAGLMIDRWSARAALGLAAVMTIVGGVGALVYAAPKARATPPVPATTT